MGSLGSDYSQLATQQELREEHQTEHDQSKAVEDAPQIHCFAKPDSTTVGTVLILIFYHMLPFTGVPHLVLCYWTHYLQRESPFIGLTAYFGVLVLLVFVPPYYSKSVRRRVRVLYEALAVYLPSAKFIIVPKEELPQDKAYIFAFHPHGRMFYAYTMFSQLHEIWRAPLQLNHGTH